MGEKGIRIEIAKALTATYYIVTGNEMTVAALEVMVEDLVPHGINDVIAALVRCRRECRGRMSLADVLERIETADGRVGADEAWAISIKAQDESETVVWTQEMADAFSLARPLLEINDKTGARMAFKDAYVRIVQVNREQGVEPIWRASLGFDAERRAEVLRSAIDSGRLSKEKVSGLLPPPPVDANSSVARLTLAACDGLLTSKGDDELERKKARERLAELRAMLSKHRGAA